MISTLLPLLIAIPLLGAATLVIFRIRMLALTLLIAIPALVSTSGAALLIAHQNTPVIAHHVGAYIPGIAIVFVSDSFSALMLLVTGFLTMMSAIYLMISKEASYRFVPSLILLLTTGVNGAIITGDLFNLFVFIEVMLLPSYALIAITGSWRRLGVGRMFVIVNLLTSSILVMGVGLIYGAIGSVNLAQLANAAASNHQVGLACAVVLLAFLIKGGIAPVHGWLASAYPVTSAGIMALFSGLHTKVGLYAVYRIYSIVYGGQPDWRGIFAIVLIATVVIGSISTFGQKRIRSALAHQMVAGVGQILIGLVVFTQLSLAAGILYMIHHMVTMGALIMGSGAIEATYGSGRTDRLRGLMKREPVMAMLFALGLFSLVGFPPTSGLWGKTGLILGASGDSTWQGTSFIVTIVIASIISLMALQFVWGRVFWGPPMKTYQPDDLVTARGKRVQIDDSTKIPAAMMCPAGVLVGVSVTMFLFIGEIAPFIQRAAAGLVDINAYISAVLR